MGAPYILMDYIHGNVASEMRLAKDCALSLYNTPKQDRSFRREVAMIQAVLATFTFDQSEAYIKTQLQKSSSLARISRQIRALGHTRLTTLPTWPSTRFEYASTTPRRRS